MRKISWQEGTILNLGKQSILLDVEDASLSHDRYLYNQYLR
jgi:hypothetical protein